MMKFRGFPIAVWVWYATIGLGVLGVSLVKPLFNWDVIGYVGSAKSLETADVRSLHQFTYGEVQGSVPSSTFAVIAPAPPHSPVSPEPKPDIPPSVSEYRSAMRADPVAFAEQLPLYHVRFIYVYLVFALYKLGTPIVLATYAVSGVSVCIGIWVLAWMARGRVGTSAAVVLPVLALAFGAITVGRLSTPDGMAFLGFMVCMVLFLNDRWESMILALALIGIRTDLVLFSAPFLLYCAFFSRFRKALSIAAFVMSCGLYLWVKWHYGYPGWSTMFRFAIGEWVPHPLTTPATVTVSQYLKAFFIGMWSGANKPAFLLFLVIVAWAGRLIFQEMKSGTPVQAIARMNVVAAVSLSVIYVLAHFLLFPELQERFFLGPYLVSAVALAALLEDREMEDPGSVE
jgi:hypothetical protein